MIDMALADSLIDALRVLAFVSLSLSFAWQIISSDRMDYKIIIRVVLLTMFLGFYGSIVKWGGDVCTDILQDSDNRLTQKLAELSGYKGSAGFSFLEHLTLWSLQILRVGTTVIKEIESFIRGVFILLLKISAPLIIAMGAWRMFENVLAKFIQATIWVCFFNLSFAIADAMIFKFMCTQFSMLQAVAIGVAGGVAALAASVLFPIFIKVFLFMVIFYFLAPVVLYKVISGGDITSAITDSVKSAVMISGPTGKAVGMAARLPGAATSALDAGTSAGGGVGNRLRAAGSAFSSALSQKTPSQSDVIAGGVSKALSGDAGKTMAAEIAKVMKGEK